MSERLYSLLPALYRARDFEQGEPLRALLAVIETEVQALEENIEATYDNWFIETCDEWVVPYIGDLLGVRPLQSIGQQSASLRRYVAQTLSFRQRKGTASVLEDLARAATSWPAAAVEMFQRLPVTQHLNRVRLDEWRTPDLRDSNALELLDGPFDDIGRFVDVRSVAARRGKHNIPHVALFVWRLEALAVDEAPALADAAAGPGRYLFSQLGRDIQLFNPARDEADLVERTREATVPGPLRRRAVHDELERARAALTAGESPSFAFLPPDDPEGEESNEAAFRVFEIDSTGAGAEIEPQRIQVCDLSAWTTVVPPATTFEEDGAPASTRVAVDPALGRLVFLPPTSAPAGVRVSYRLGFPGQIGGGTYERGARLSDATGRDLRAVVTADPAAAVDDALAVELDTWSTGARDSVLFEIRDCGAYSVRDLEVPEGKSVEIRSGDGSWATLRPSSPWRIKLHPGSSLVLDGLLVVGAGLELETVAGTGAAVERTVTLQDLTLAPATSGVSVVAGSNGKLDLVAARCVLGPVDLTVLGDDGSSAAIEDSIIDALDDGHLALTAGELTIHRSTVVGRTAAGQIEAHDDIFTGRILVARTQVGCVRFSYVRESSRIPRSYRCVAEPAPSFTSRTHGDAAYLQLGPHCAAEIAAGASDGSEMGAWSHLRQPQREANLATALDEYLRFGLEAGVFKVT